MQTPSANEDFSLKETKPHLGGGAKDADLVEQIQYLYFGCVATKNLSYGCDTYAKLWLSNSKDETRQFDTRHFEWNQVFAFSKNRIEAFSKDSDEPATNLEVKLKNKGIVTNVIGGRVSFVLKEVSERLKPDGSLAAQWYKMEDRTGKKLNEELMLAVWWGTQAEFS